jgi:hypothetical protein
MYKILSGLIFFIYSSWSKLYRKIWHLKYANVQVMQGLTPSEAQKFLNIMQWRKDSSKEFFDSIGSPNWFQHCLNEVINLKKQPKGALDCDDFASWFAHAIHPRFRPILFSIVYLDKDEKLTGHVVCVWQDSFGKYNHSGIGLSRRGFDSYKDITKDIVHIFNIKKIVGGYIFDKNLKLIKSFQGYP